MIRAIVYEHARDSYRSGAMDEKEFAEFEAGCLVPVPHYVNGRRLRKLRRRYRLTSQQMAELLNTSTRTLQRWEYGQTLPRGSAKRLLELLACKGPDAVLVGKSPVTIKRAVATRARRAAI